MADQKITAKDEDIDDKKIDNDDDGESGKQTTIKKDDAGANNDDDDDSDDSDEDDDEGVKPPVRKSIAQHIISRKNKTIEKLRSKQDEDDDADDDDNSDIDDELNGDKSTERVIGKQVQKHIAPVIEALASKADDDELLELFATEPDSKKYEKRIRAYMGSEHYRGVPPAVIYHHLAFQKASGEQADKKRAADFEARGSRGAGTGRRPRPNAGNIPTKEDMENMSDAEIEKLQQDAMSGKFRE